MTNGGKAREIEATLIICSAEPEVIAREIAGLSSIENYRLLPQDSKEIHDRYFDTVDRTLESRKLALRVRQIGGRSWITLKGPSQASGWDGVILNSFLLEESVFLCYEKRKAGHNVKVTDLDCGFPLDGRLKTEVESNSQAENHDYYNSLNNIPFHCLPLLYYRFS